MERAIDKLRIGSLLHDIANIIFDECKPSEMMERIDKEPDSIKISDCGILNCVKYQTGEELRQSNLEQNAPAFITYVANRIVAGINLREQAEFDEVYDKTLPLYSIFNLLNQDSSKKNDEYKFYKKQILSEDSSINFPTLEEAVQDDGFYDRVKANLKNIIEKISIDSQYVNQLSKTLQENLSYIPSVTLKGRHNDISFYDNLKMRTAVSNCIYLYLKSLNEENYKSVLLDDMDDFYEKKAFMLYSVDVSGIQNFIYTISSKGALKGLRARSFYLDLMMEYIADEFLERFELTRHNLIYSGGGHNYMLLPNTQEVKSGIEKLEQELNTWFIQNFGISLFVAGGYYECSANELQNIPNGSYSNLFKEVSANISKKKSHRYSAHEIRFLNSGNNREKRECSICRKLDSLDEEERCKICSKLFGLSNEILSNEFFIVLSHDYREALALPFNKFLVSCKEQDLYKNPAFDHSIRIYQKNSFKSDFDAKRIFIGDYRPKGSNHLNVSPTFEELAKSSKGIERIAVLRADVDNLGTAFVSGFDGNKEENHATLARTSTLSNQLSLFFKYHINSILRNGNYDVLEKSGDRDVVIVYSGGDDMFLVGAWNDVVQSGIDITGAFEKFVQSTLTISAGIGIYASGYPINVMAKEVEILEDLSKHYMAQGQLKNAISLFDDSNTYHWNTFVNEVMGEKFKIIKEFFDDSEDRGKNFLYNLLELMRNSDQKINIARFVYLLSRLEPKKSKEEEANSMYKKYKKFSQKMYEWIRNEKDKKQAITAIYLYVYLTRAEGER